MEKESSTNDSRFPLIPDKRFLTIGEVSQWCGVEQHVLRYWESVFPQINPERRDGSRRLYRRQDLEAVRAVYVLLREKKYTIDGALKQMNEKSVASEGAYDDKAMLRSVRSELENILQLLK